MKCNVKSFYLPRDTNKKNMCALVVLSLVNEITLLLDNA